MSLDLLTHRYFNSFQSLHRRWLTFLVQQAGDRINMGFQLGCFLRGYPVGLRVNTSILNAFGSPCRLAVLPLLTECIPFAEQFLYDLEFGFLEYGNTV